MVYCSFEDNNVVITLPGSFTFSLSYVTAADAAAFKESLEGRPPQSPSTPTMMPSPK